MEPVSGGASTKKQAQLIINRVHLRSITSILNNCNDEIEYSFKRYSPFFIS